MNTPLHTETIVISNERFLISLYYDGYRGAPWEETYGHGPVREIRRKDEKRPGERIIHDERGNFWAYDFQEAMKEARTKWGIKSGTDAVKYVENDIKYLRGYLRDDWHYCGVAVNLLDSEGEPIGGEFENAIWGVESSDDYWKEVANDLAGEILSEKQREHEKYVRESIERTYWASRDVVTEEV